MKCLPVMLMVVFFLSDCTSSKSNHNTQRDISSLKWIEGNWMGKDGNNMFYEIYTLTGDSTLEIISYEWDGKDSSGTSRSYIRWKDNSFFLGDSLNWQVTGISKSEIIMIPHYKASNHIAWKYKSINSWEAVLTSQTKEKIYEMQGINHFKK